MTLETLEKLLAYIDLVKYGPFTPRAKARDELRALVKAESEPEAGFQPILEELDQIADEMSNEKRGDAKMDDAISPLNPPSDVQSEGRGEALTEKVVLDAIYDSGLDNYFSVINTVWKDGIDIDKPCSSIMDFAKRVIKYTNQDSPKHKPHNPDNLPSPGEGYRFLDEDEIQDGPMLREIHVWYKDRWVTDDPDGYCGWGKRDTYRTHLTREQLAKKRKEAGK